MGSVDLVAGIDLGGTKIHAALVDATGKIYASDRCKTRPEEGPDAVNGRMVELVDGLCREQGIAPSTLKAVSNGVPGGSDDAAGMVDKAPNLGWTKVPLAKRLTDALGVGKVILDNDVRVAVIGEWA